MTNWGHSSLAKTVWLAFSAVAIVAVAAAQPRVTPWDRLPVQSAWVDLGLWSVQTGRWMTLPSFTNETRPSNPKKLLTGEFERPLPGDVLRVTHRWELYVRGYRIGDLRIDEPPSGTMTSDDHTGEWLGPGETVTVVEISDATMAPVRSVWARVIPGR